MNDRFLTEEDIPWLYNFTVTKGNIHSVLEYQDIKCLKAVGEWLESKVVGFLAGDLSKLIIATEAIEAFKRGEMPDMGNRED